MSFKNKVVIVTGAGSGIGAAMAIKFGAEGAHVVLAGRRVEKLNAVAAQCGDSLVIQSDITKDEDCEKIMNEAVKKFGKLDVLVNNAGTVPSGSLFDGKLLQAYDIAMKEKVRAVAYLTALAVPHLKKTKGNIVNISGAGGQTVPYTPGVIMFFTAEAAMNHFSKCAAAELAKYGIRVNVISPGPVNTPILAVSLNQLTHEHVTKISALGRASEPEEIAELVLFVASDKGRSITGSNFNIDNGLLLR